MRLLRKCFLFLLALPYNPGCFLLRALHIRFFSKHNVPFFSSYNPPAYITEEEYKRARSNINNELPEYVGFIGFGSSFGGKWFGGYGKSKKPNGEIRWHSEETKRALERDMKYLMNVEFTCLDYKDVEIPKGSVVYADPPYANTTTYQGQKLDRKSTRLNSSHIEESRMPSSA